MVSELPSATQLAGARFKGLTIKITMCFNDYLSSKIFCETVPCMLSLVKYERIEQSKATFYDNESGVSILQRSAQPFESYHLETICQSGGRFQLNMHGPTSKTIASNNLW